MLKDFPLSQRRLPDHSGFPLSELYVFFTSATGWIAPVSIYGMGNDKKSRALRSTSARACRTHESDWSDLFV